MSEPTASPDEGLEFLKELPPLPAEPPRRNRLQLTLQILAVPLTILIFAVGIFVVISFMTRDTMTAAQLLDRVRSSTGQVRKQYANEFVRKLLAAREDRSQPPPPELRELVPALLASIQALQALAPLEMDDEQTLRILIHALGNIQDRESAAKLVEFMEKERNPYVIAECLSALGSIGNPESAPAIRAQLRGEHPYARKFAAFNLAALRDPEQTETLKKLLRDESMEVRWNAAFGLAYYLGDRSGAPILRSMLQPDSIPKSDPYGEVLRSQAILMAARGLAVIKDADALPILREIAEKDGSIEVRDGCRKAIEIIEAK
jgi:HEAT repeat protein